MHPTQKDISLIQSAREPFYRIYDANFSCFLSLLMSCHLRNQHHCRRQSVHIAESNTHNLMWKTQFMSYLCWFVRSFRPEVHKTYNREFFYRFSLVIQNSAAGNFVRPNQANPTNVRTYMKYLLRTFLWGQKTTSESAELRKLFSFFGYKFYILPLFGKMVTI